VRLGGDIDLSTASRVRRRLHAHVQDEGDLVVDARDVSFIDVGGCRAIIETAAELKGEQRLVLRDAPPQLVRVLSACGWDRDPHLEVIPREAGT
jgi:anti-anti-sigma factor